MTEAEWLAWKEPKAMLNFIGEKASSRKLRLLITAYTRRYLSQLDEWNRERTTEKADQLERLADADLSGVSVGLNTGNWQPADTPLVRELFGNPFRPVAFAREWRTDTAVTLARQMYEARGFSAMPILADALQDAGCDSDDILNHCRDTERPHVRGCWVCDLVLGKE